MGEARQEVVMHPDPQTVAVRESLQATAALHISLGVDWPGVTNWLTESEEEVTGGKGAPAVSTRATALTHTHTHRCALPPQATSSGGSIAPATEDDMGRDVGIGAALGANGPSTSGGPVGAGGSAGGDPGAIDLPSVRYWTPGSGGPGGPLPPMGSVTGAAGRGGAPALEGTCVHVCMCARGGCGVQEDCTVPRSRGRWM